jgi:CRP/FNR family transcriptional regulator, cyclic AMP receptor protein
MAKAAHTAFDATTLLSTVNHGRTLREYAFGDAVFAQGDPADAVFYVQSGDVKIVVTSEQGKEGIVGVLTAGEFFGEGCLVGQPLRLSSGIALTDCEVMRIDKAEMVRLLHAEPDIAELFMAHLLTRNGRIEADLVDQLFNSSEKRLARTLLLLANFGKDGAPQAITAKVSQETLAGIVGTTRSRISFFMNKFRRLGFIEYNGHLEVHSSLLTVLLRE